MRVFSLALLAATVLALPAAAQTPPAVLGDRYVPAPWWMRDPVIASIGSVRVEIPANRASFTANFQVVDRSAPEATVQAADKVRALGQALQAFGADKVVIETTFTTRPLYEQYKDKEGNIQENERADKIERYEVDAVVSVEIRDTSLLEKTYATVMAAKPTSTSGVGFSLDPENATKTALYAEAIKDAARRARLAVDAAGAKVGAVKVIDPTGRACRTDVLAGWPSYMGNSIQPTTVASEDVGVPAPAPPMGMAMAKVAEPLAARRRGDAIRPEDMQLPLQPPMRELTADACVIYGLV